jgi:hypothetical protein
MLSAALLTLAIAGCTKLKEGYRQTVTLQDAKNAFPASLFLQTAYTDFAAPFVNQDRVFSLEQCSSDETLVPTRGGDWDDNGVWRVIHNHTWNADHDQVLQVYNLLNKINFDATNVLQFTPTKEQIAEARFLRAYSLYYLFDLYNQFPFRNPGDNLLDAPKVYTGDSAVAFLISELNGALADLDPNNTMAQANQDACKALLMRVYLNKGAWLNRANPTFADADMQQVITLGQQIMSSGKYHYMSNYFGNFNFANGGSTEGIFAYPSSSGVAANNGGVQARWMMTFHYNEYDGQAPNAGWNGFSTISDFYNAFSVGGTTDYTLKDTLLDQRIGRRWTSDQLTTATSGIRPGFLVGQQYDQNGVALQDRKSHPLAFDPVIASNMIEQGTNLEVTGIRVAKYVPDFSDPGGKFYSSNAGNWLMLIRYPEVVMMVAEAKMRAAAADVPGALTLINGLRAARGASTVVTMPLVNPANAEDPKTLLAERGREFYWESLRRTDLIRFGVFLLPWQYKPSDDPKYLLFPVPNQALAVNPNLKQNPGY